MSAPFNDEPTLADCLGRAGWVKWFGENIRNCSPPYVFGIHADWGAGKTSFLHQIYGHFTGYDINGDKLPPQVTGLWGKKWKASEKYVVIWFEAWRYQHEVVPIVALLHELRGQWAWYRKTFAWIKKIGEVTTRGALLVLDEATRKIGKEYTLALKPSSSGIQALGEKWESDHFTAALPTQQLREFLCDAIQTLIGGKGRVLILVDDLDRCQPEAAYKFLEGIKIYLNLPNCVFVLAMDHLQLERAIAQRLPGAMKSSGGADNFAVEALQQSREYLEKICQDVWHLPLIPFDKHCEFMNKCLDGQCSGHEATVAGVLLILKDKSYLPSNARKLKAYANTLRRFVEHCQNPQGWAAAQHQRMLIICSCIYQFHPEIYRRLEANPGFYNEVREWVLTGQFANPVFNNIEIAGLGPAGPKIASGGLRAAFVSFPDAATGNVFRIRELVDQAGPITEAEAKNYLLPYARA